MTTQKTNPFRIVICSGEPAGVGPDLCRMLPAAVRRQALIVGDENLLRGNRPAKLTLTGRTASNIEHVPVNVPVRAGKPDPRNVPYLLEIIRKSVRLAQSMGCDLVTCPTDKSLIASTGTSFTGLTTYLREICQTAHPSKSRSLSMFVGRVSPREILRVSFVSMHIPLSEVAGNVNTNSKTTEDTVKQTNRVLKDHFGISQPRLALCGLNPHAGENGLLGKEETKHINACAAAMRKNGIKLEGPLAADSLFAPINRKRFDCIIAMFHDQGLAPFKALTFGRGAQVTFGLPFIRTSPDHGTAYGLAGTDKINHGSMEFACRLIDAIRTRTAG